MKKLVITCIAIALISPAHAEPDLTVNSLLIKAIEIFNLRPLPTKRFEETAKYNLGRALFFDPILSGNRDISCATCHLLSRGSSDHLSASIGTGGVGLAEMRVLPSDRPHQPRNALDLWNRDNNTVRTMLWDGRVEAIDPILRTFRSPLGDLLPTGLENTMAVQVLFPMAQDDEMLGLADDRSPIDLPQPHANRLNEFATNTKDLLGPMRIKAILRLIMDRLIGTDDAPQKPWHAQYRALLRSAYPTVQDNAFTIVHVANSIAHYIEMTFATRQTPWDRFLAGDPTAIGLQAQKGAFLFYGRARCVACHSGPLLSDFEFYSIGVPDHGTGIGKTEEDLGRYLVTGNESDRYKFRTPPLRNVTLTSPYFHNGSAETLEDVVKQHIDPLFYADKYDETGGLILNPAQIDAISPILLPKIRLTHADIQSLISFLTTLEDPGYAHVDKLVPASVPSGLPISALNPN